MCRFVVIFMSLSSTTILACQDRCGGLRQYQPRASIGGGRWNLCFTFTPCRLDAYRLRPKRRIPALCVTYSRLSDDKFLCQNVGLGSSTPHGHRSVGDKGTTSPHFSAWWDSIGNVPPHFQFIKTNLQAYSEADHSPLLKTLHRSSSKINIRVQI